MQEIQQQAAKTYEANMEYFEKNHPELYKRLTTLQTAIDSELYHEKYALEYRNEGYFDIQDLATAAWLYGKDSNNFSKNIVNVTDLKRTGGIFQAQKFVDFSPEMPDIIDQSQLHFHNALWATIKIVEYHKKHISKTDEMNTVFKSIFIGVGLGLHILATVEKLSSKIIFIVEQNLELFRLSLFVTDYAKIAEKRVLFFSIMDDELTERKTFINFLETGNNYNLYIKHIPFIKDYESFLRRLQTHVLSQSFISYGYSALLLRAIESPRFIAQGRPFLNLGNFYTDSLFSKKPVLFLFSGPSTGKNIEWIVENQKYFIIVSALSTCRLLNKFGIKPDIVVHIDPAEHETLALLEGIDIESFFQNVALVFSSSVFPAVVEKFNKKYIHFIEQGTEYKKDFPNLSSPSVGEYSYALFLVCGISNLYLLGLDLALDPITLSTHSELHPFATSGEIDNEGVNLGYKTATEFVRGNFLSEVPTLALYKISINEFNRFSNMFKQTWQNVYNLGNGAYLEGTIPLNIKDISIDKYEPINKISLQREMKDFFDSISSAEFREEDKETIKYQINEAKILLKKINVHKNKKYKNISEYLDAVSQLSWNLSDMENRTKSYLAEVYYEYLKIVLSYIFDLFNTKNPTATIKEIDTLLVKQLNKMGNLFVTTLEGYLTKK